MERTLRVSSLVAVLAVVAIAGCQFSRPPDVEATDAPPPIDRPPTAPQLETSRDPNDFGGVVIGGSSSTYILTVQNIGDLTAGTIGVSLTGASPSEFEIVPTGDSSDCSGKVLAGGETCRAQVRYKPTVDQSAAASFVIAADPGGTIAVPITGDAQTAARLTSLTTTENFGGVVLGASSLIHHITIQNDGEQPTGPLGLSKAGPNEAEFSIIPLATGDCQGAMLGQQATCQIDVRFTPSAASTQRTATITIAGTPGGMYAITATGDGLNPGDLTIEQPTGGAPLDFGARNLGTGATSATQTIRVRNTGGVPTGALVVTTTGGASASYALPLDGCNGNPLGAGAACDIQVRFNPAAIGTQPATIQIRDNASGGTQAVNVSGVGTGNIVVTKVGTGTVQSAPAGINCTGTCTSQTGSFSTTPVTLTANPDPGWIFDGWGGACASAGTAAACSLPIASALANVSATFRQLLTLSVAVAGFGDVASIPAGINCGVTPGSGSCNSQYAMSTVVQLTATPYPGWEVTSWGAGGCSFGAHVCLVNMAVPRNINVTFSPIPLVPPLYTPLNDAYVGSVHAPLSRRVRFTWNPGGVPLGGPLTYDLQYSTDPGFAANVTTVPGLTGTTFQVSADLPVSTLPPVGQRYYWRVRSCTAVLCSAYSPYYSVNVGRSDSDLDGDGYSELVVAAPKSDIGGIDTGKVYVYRGSPTGLSLAASIVGAPREEVATSLATGDFNGDGFGDLVVGVKNNGETAEWAGKVSVYNGAATLDVVPDLMIYGAWTDFFGTGLAVGDVNSDGFDDLVVQSLSEVKLYHGGGAMDGIADRVYTGAFGPQPAVGDITGDGYPDLLMPANGSYMVFRGGSGSLSPVADAAGLPCAFAATVGDIGGDGAADIVCRRVDAGSGVATPVLLMFGYQQSLPEVALGIPLGTSWDWVSADAIGDANRDGRLDFAIGQGPPDSPGRVMVYFGGAPTDGVADAVYDGAGTVSQSGTALCGGGDVNGDGIADFAEGAITGRLNQFLAPPGLVHVFYGVAASVVQPYNVIEDFVGEGETDWAQYGARCAL